MELMEAIRERRSVRKYRPDTIPDDMLNKVLEAAQMAPSWANTQCWRLVVVRQGDTKVRLAETLKSSRPGGKNNAYDAVREAAVVIVACGERGLSGCFKVDDKRVPSTDKGDWWFMFDLGLAMQNLTLAAHALGLGTVHIGLFDSAAAGKVIGVPENVSVVELLPLGWPAEKPPPRSRKALGEFVFSEVYPQRSPR